MTLDEIIYYVPINLLWFGSNHMLHALVYFDDLLAMFGTKKTQENVRE